MRKTFLVWCLLIVVSTGAVRLADAEQSAVNLADSAIRRRPVAAVLINGGRQLCVANRQSGSLSLIDLERREVIREQRIGQHLSDIALLPDGQTLLVTDATAHELVVVRATPQRIEVVQRLPTVRYPISIVVDDRQGKVAVAGLWSRRVSLLDVGELSTTATPAKIASQSSGRKTVDLPFSPRRMLFIDEGHRLVVADAFGGRVALVDASTGNVDSVRELPAQNIRGLTLSVDGDQLLLAHQILHPAARTDYDDVHWGTLLQNVVREIPLIAILDPQADLDRASRVVPLGEIGNGAADPAGIAALPSLNGWMTCLSGTNEVSIRTRHGGGRVQVGVQPTGIVWDADRQLAYVLCTLDDSVAVIDPRQQKLVARVALGRQPEPTPADRGERMFVDGRRSHDGWLSCQSCHPDGHTTGALADTMSDGSYGTPKRILSLLGTRDNNPWAWNGQFRELHEQVASSFTSTLQGDPLRVPEISDVVAYLHTLPPPPPVEEVSSSGDEAVHLAAGRRLFTSLGCVDCHVPPQTYTIDQSFDVGLQDEAGLTKFNPPSLRGISQRDRFFHDARAESLEAVFEEYGHQLSEALRPEQLQNLLTFLDSL